MELTPLGIEGTWLAQSPVWKDDRGFFREWFKVEDVKSVTGRDFTIEQANLQDNPQQEVESNTRAYYASIKRNFPNQYGQIENIRYVSTGYSAKFYQNDRGEYVLEKKYYPAFGL